MTTNELQNRWRYGYLMDNEGRFVNPFDQGKSTNCLTFWGCKDHTALSDLSIRLHPPTVVELEKNRERALEEAQKAANAQPKPPQGETTVCWCCKLKHAKNPAQEAREAENQGNAIIIPIQGPLPIPQQQQCDHHHH
eukprot:TRINITY_DN10563_c0_g2_i2.p2 TRINITY_DN10563_c0_g2~~TRINITY_DN10563_c0_g2_i2.p2  ORF type:complete len:137 (-),score=37.61 TRINITY_DN10563_c0_g2_i2:189-599(-)